MGCKAADWMLFFIDDDDDDYVLLMSFMWIRTEGNDGASFIELL